MTSPATLSQQAHILLVLGRVSNLPTVWSNCLAAWWLGGAGAWQSFALLCLGATLLYTGGMFLNDAFDVEFDRKYRSERPIVSDRVSLRFVWIAGVAFLCVGWLCLVPIGRRATAFGALLVICIVVYNAIHKKTPLAPFLMATCRFLLYLTAASGAQLGPGRPVILFAFALFCYIVGLSYMARVESTGGLISHWPMVLLFVPGLVAFSLAGRGTQFWMIPVLQILWVLWCLTGRLPGIRRVLNSGVAGLLAGIPLVDWVAVGYPARPEFGVVFPALFLLALLLQRVAPAT